MNTTGTCQDLRHGCEIDVSQRLQGLRMMRKTRAGDFDLNSTQEVTAMKDAKQGGDKIQVQTPMQSFCGAISSQEQVPGPEGVRKAPQSSTSRNIVPIRKEMWKT